MCIFFSSLIFGLIVLFFVKNHKDVIDDPSEKEVENMLDEEIIIKDTKRAHSEISILIRIFDVLVGLYYQMYVIIQLVGFLFIQMQFAYDSQSKVRNKYFTIPIYMFCFSLGDAIGKFVPEKLFIKNVILTHMMNINFILLYSLFIFMLKKDVGEYWSNPFLRIAIIFLCGLLNGFNINNFMSNATQRFKKSMDKSRSGYYCVFFILIGIAFAGLINTMYLGGT